MHTMGAAAAAPGQDCAFEVFLHGMLCFVVVGSDLQNLHDTCAAGKLQRQSDLFGIFE